MKRQMRAAFDQEAFAATISAVIDARGVTDREAGRQAGVSPSTITRSVRQELRPDVDSLVLLADWAGVPLEAFARRTRPLEASGTVGELHRVVSALRAAHEAAEAVLASALPTTQENE